MRLPSLRSRLLLLAFASMVPILVLSLALAWLLVQREEALMREGAITRTRAVASAVDARLDGHLAALRALGTLRSLEQGDLAAFHEAALRAKAAQPHWRNVLLIDDTGRQLLNLRIPRGSALPAEDDAELASLHRVLASGEAQIGNVGRGPVSGFVGVPLQIRVSVAGELRALKLILDPQAFAVLMTAQQLPSTWAGAIIDGNGRFVARVPTRPAGDPVSPSLHAALRESRSGWRRLPTLEGVDAQQAFVGSTLSDWTIAVAIPRSEMVAASRSAALSLLAGAAISLALGAGLALAMSRRVSTPMLTLARAAGGVGTADVAPLLKQVEERPGFAEALDVSRALQHAAASLDEREVLRKREQTALREADQAKNEFLAMLGHELRNPLSAITTSARVLRISQPDADTSMRAQQVIERQSRQMARLVEDLMDISRLATGKLRLELEQYDLNGVVQRAVAAWRQANPHHAADIRYAGTPAWVRIDRARIDQIVVNLLDNASKFSPTGGVIEVAVRTQGRSAVLEVRDHGQGIAADDLPLVFETFYQGRQLPHRPRGGLGLGLALVKRLAELHGGRASACSAGPGQGAAITVSLPLAVPSDTGAGGASTPPARAPTRRRILVVEDNEDGRNAMTLMLELNGHEVVAVGTGMAALEIVRARPPDVAIVDIGLPDINGWEVARRIREIALEHPVRLVAISGFGQPEDKSRSLQAGFEIHMTKPVDPDELATILDA